MWRRPRGSSADDFAGAVRDACGRLGLTVVALDADRKPVAVPPLVPVTADQQRRHAAAIARRELRREIEQRSRQIRQRAD